MGYKSLWCRMTADSLYQLLLWGEIMAAPLVLLLLLKISAPYGRHYRPGWGPTLNNRLAWLVMELPALIMLPLLYLTSPVPLSWHQLLLFLWVWHYGYRSLIFPLLLRSSQRNFPFSVALMAVSFNLINGYINGYALFVEQTGWGSINPWVLAGLLVFAGGWWIHFHSDRVLRRLRQPGGPRYGIPRGGLFRWVSSPQYLGEMIQWLGWALLTGTLAGLAFALFTAANLLPRAVANHHWYKSEFPDYPVERKILLPGVF